MDIVFPPIEEALVPSPFVIYMKKFLFGYFHGWFSIEVFERMPPYMQKKLNELSYYTGAKPYPKRYTLGFTIESLVSWFIYSSDVLRDVRRVEDELVNRLKLGEEIKVTDFTHQVRPLYISPYQIRWTHGK